MMLSSHIFLRLPCLLFSSIVPCKPLRSVSCLGTCPYHNSCLLFILCRRIAVAKLIKLVILKCISNFKATEVFDVKLEKTKYFILIEASTYLIMLPLQIRLRQMSDFVIYPKVTSIGFKVTSLMRSSVCIC